MLDARAQTWIDNAKRDYGHIPVLSLEEIRALPEAVEFDAGIYFLWNGAELQYIGKSLQVLTRIGHHGFATRYGYPQSTYNNHVPSDRHTCLVLASGRYREPGIEKQLYEYEHAYIAHFMPPFNFLGDMP